MTKIVVNFHSPTFPEGEVTGAVNITNFTPAYDCDDFDTGLPTGITVQTVDQAGGWSGNASWATSDYQGLPAAFWQGCAYTGDTDTDRTITLAGFFPGQEVTIQVACYLPTTQFNIDTDVTVDAVKLTYDSPTVEPPATMLSYTTNADINGEIDILWEKSAANTYSAGGVINGLVVEYTPPLPTAGKIVIDYLGQNSEPAETNTNGVYPENANQTLTQTVENSVGALTGITFTHVNGGMTNLLGQPPDNAPIGSLTDEFFDGATYNVSEKGFTVVFGNVPINATGTVGFFGYRNSPDVPYTSEMTHGGLTVEYIQTSAGTAVPAVSLPLTVAQDGTVTISFSGTGSVGAIVNGLWIDYDTEGEPVEPPPPVTEPTTRTVRGLFINVNDILNRVAAECGIAPVSDPYASSDPTFVRLIYLLLAAGEELVIAHPWQILQRTYTVTVEAGKSEYDLPSDFAYMIPQTGWVSTTNLPVCGPLSPQEWTYRTGRGLGDTSIHVSFRVSEGYFKTLPENIPEGTQITFEYICKNWVIESTSPFTEKDTPQSSADIIRFDKTLITRYLKVKYLESQGFDTTKAQDDFNMMFSFLTSKDTSAKVLNAGRGSGYQTVFLGYGNIPETGFGHS